MIGERRRESWYIIQRLTVYNMSPLYIEENQGYNDRYNREIYGDIHGEDDLVIGDLASTGYS